MPQYDLDIRDYWRIIKKRKVVIILTTALVGFFSFIFAQINAPKPIYEATSEVKYEKSTASSTMSLFAERFYAVSWDIIATQALVIKSFPVMDRVAKELGMIDRSITTDQIIKSKHLLDMIATIQKNISTEQKEKTNIITISGQSHDPKIAQRIANTVAQAYREFNIAEVNHRSIEAAKFIEQQIKIIGEKLRTAEEKLKAFKESNDIVSLDFKTTSSLTLQADAEAEYEKVKNELKETEIQLTLVKQDKTLPPDVTSRLTALTPLPKPGYIDTTSGKVVSPEVTFASSGLSRLNDMLVDLTMQRGTLLLDFTEAHPKVKEIEARIKAVRSEIKGALLSKFDDLKRQESVLGISIEKLSAENSMLPESALQLARYEREVKVNEELFSLLKSKYQEALIKVSERAEEVTIIRPASEPFEPTNPPKIGTTTIIGTIIGLMLGLVFSFLMETVDTSIGTIEDVEAYLGVPVLGIIPEIDMKEFREKYAPIKDLPEDDPLLERYVSLIAHFSPKSPVAEAYRSLRTNLQFLGLEKKGKSFIITSSTLREGKTTNVINLALTMAQAGNKVLIVESDLRKPSVYSVFGLEREPGLTDIILGNYKWQDVVKGITDIMMGNLEMADIMKTPGMDNLHIITCGSVPPNPSELLSSPKISEFISDVEKNFDIILFDTPPVLPVADTPILSQKIDATILVYEVGKVARGVLKRAKTQIDNVKGSVWGIILNNVKAEVSPDYYKYHMSYYYGTGEQRAHAQISKVYGNFQDFLSRFTKRINEIFSTNIPRFLKIILIIISILLIITGILWQMNYLHGSENRVIPGQDRLREVFKEKQQSLPYPKTIMSLPKNEETLETEIIADKKFEPLTNKQFSSSLNHYPYSILISSNQDKGHAVNDLKKFESQGYQAYLNFANIEGKGGYYRVFLGVYEKEDEAREVAKKIRGSFIPSVISTPYSLELGVFSTQDSAEREKDRLERKGYFPYLLSEQEGKSFDLLLGAFATSDELVTLSQQLKAEGIAFQVVRR